MLRSKVAAVESDPQLTRSSPPHTPTSAKHVLQETAQLHAGDPTNVALWHEFLPPCLAEIDVIYHRLGVTFDHTLGESFYHDRLRGVVEDLNEKGSPAKATAPSACSSTATTRR